MTPPIKYTQRIITQYLDQLDATPLQDRGQIQRDFAKRHGIQVSTAQVLASNWRRGHRSPADRYCHRTPVVPHRVRYQPGPAAPRRKPALVHRLLQFLT